jgi:hypothetical protein
MKRTDPLWKPPCRDSPCPRGGVLFLAEADVAETIKVLGDVLKFGEWKCGTAKPDTCTCLMSN